LSIDRHENEGSDAIAFLTNLRNSHLSKSGPCWSLLLICESWIPRDGFRARLLVEYRLEGRLPTLAKCRNLERSLKVLARMSWQIQESVDVSDRHSFRTIADFYDFIALADFSLLQHAKVKTGSSVCNKQRRHTRFIHADADAVARHARLCYFEFSVTNAVSITNTDLVIGKSFNSKILSKLAENKIIASQKTLPVTVGIDLIDEHGALLPPMTGEIRLCVANNIELLHRPSFLDRRFPNRR